MSDKQVRGKYTQEYKLEAVRQVKAGQSIAVIAKVLGIPKASLSNWVRLSAKGVLNGAGDKPAAVMAEQMELARLRAEVARLRMERDIAKKAAAYFAQDTHCQVGLDLPNEKALSVTAAYCTYSARTWGPPFHNRNHCYLSLSSPAIVGLVHIVVDPVLIVGGDYEFAAQIRRVSDSIAHPK
jgi:transposase